MEDLESIKNERRRILSTLENWNVGITPNGKLATESCFVHNSVPEIVFNKNKKLIIESTYISTKSERATNLVQSSASNPCDTETIKSLSVCNSIFNQHQHYHAAAKAIAVVETIHLIKHIVKAYVIVDNIARLTKEFDDELTKAEEHWPHSPQKSWDKLCQIWNRYGFLWPQQVQIGFKIHESAEKNKERQIITSIKDHLESKSQGTLLHSPKNYSVIWRTKLQPLHEFFPTTPRYNKKRDFINNIIHQFSTLVFNDSLFRLKNVKSGDYLGRQSHLDSLLFSRDSVTVIPNNNNNNKMNNNSSVCWKFNHNLSTSTTETSPYVFIGSEKYLCSGQYDTTDVVFLSKSNQQQQQQQQNSFDRNSIISSSRANINLVHYKQQKSKDLSMSLQDTIENWKWTIGSLSPNASYITDDIFDLDKAISILRCLVHGDEITLNQHSLFLRAPAKYPSSLNNSSPFRMEHHQGLSTKSPLSITSFGDGYNFSFSEMSYSSNSTQPTSGTNSFFSPTPAQQYVNDVKSGRKYASKLDFMDQSSLQNNTLVYMEKVSPNDKTNLSADYRWKIEMISKSVMMMNNEQQNDIIKVVKSPSIKRNNESEKQQRKGHITYANIKPYSPKLNIDITRSSTPETENTKNSSPPLLPAHKIGIIGVSSMIPSEDYYENVNRVLNQQQQFPKSPQKSKWLDINPKIYSLGNDSDDDDSNDMQQQQQQSTMTSKYDTPRGSIKSITSPVASFVPEIISEKKLGKQPLHQQKMTSTAANFQFSGHRSNYPQSKKSNSSSSDSWSSSQSPSSPADKNNNQDLNNAPASTTAGSPTPALTEAETFKISIQKIYREQDNAHKMIFKNLFSSASPKSSTTSQIRYYDDDDDEDEEENSDDDNTEILDPASSQLRTYTMTPRSQRYSQPTTPSSSAFLTPEEYMKRKRSRENSFMLLLNQETKQQMWLRAIKQSTLSHWLRVLSSNTAKRLHHQHQKGGMISSSSTTNSNNHFPNCGGCSDFRLHHHHNSNIHDNRVIQKKKGFYRKKSNSNSSRRQCGIVI